jgi:hypothetical protein
LAWSEEIVLKGVEIIEEIRKIRGKRIEGEKWQRN